MTSVKFTPGPHPTSRQSTSSNRTTSSPYPTRSHASTRSPASMPTRTCSPSATVKSNNCNYHGHNHVAETVDNNDIFDEAQASSSSSRFKSIPSGSAQGTDFPSSASLMDHERQPLLVRPPTDQDVNRRRGIKYSIAVALLFLLAIGVFIGFGGWKLGKGAGGGRWPGGPGLI